MFQRTRSRFASAAAAALLVSGGLALPACSNSDAAAPVSGEARSLNESQVELMLATLREAPSHGFAMGAFGGLAVDDEAEAGDAAARAKVRQAVLDYARALHGHGIAEGQFVKAWGQRPPPYDAEAEFTKAAKAGRIAEWLETLAPNLPQYEATRTAYEQYGEIREAGGWKPLTFSTDLKRGASGPEVAALRERLAVEDPQLAKTEATGTFDPALEEAVRRAQSRYGQHVTGVVDADLREALNIPVETRMAQIRANLERLRWLPRERPATRIEVNSAAGQVDVYRDGQPALSMLAAAGKPGDETPILASKVEQVVLNPTWNVPDGIAQEELLPKGEAYLQRNNFVHNAPGEGVMLTQQPGPKNALGQVKFLFDNPYAVYLHDTPSRAAFSQEQRSVSHGCVRLAQALDLARLLLENEPGWSAERIEEVLSGQETTPVTLSQPVPVFLGYYTAYPTNIGMSFRPDVYGWDEAVLRRLDAQGSSKA